MAKTKQQQMDTSDFNMQKLSTKELAAHAKATIALEGNMAIFGRRGTGKTEICKQQIAEAGHQEIYINLSVLERVDMGGYPDVLASQREKKFVDFLLPHFYEPMFSPNGKPVSALLDEVDKADPSLWAPLLEFTQFKSINGRKLPNLKSVFMTGNLISEGGSRPSLPLLDRAEKYLVEADVQSWLAWAGKSRKIHPSISAYIQDHPQDLFGAVDPEERYADPSPRGWARASEILFKGEAAKLSTSLLNNKVAGCVGKDVGIRYSNYYEYYMELLPMIDDIYAGKNVSSKYAQLETTKKIVACMITCARLANVFETATKAKVEKSISHVGKFLQNVEYENILVAVRSQINIHRLIEHNLDEHPDWRSIFDQIQSDMETEKEV